MATISSCYTSAGCNRCPNIADWGKNGFVCFGCSNAVALYQRESSSSSCGIVSTCVGHSARVNCVSWVNEPNKEEENFFVSGSADCTVNLWQVLDGKIVCQPVHSLTGHSGSVTCVSALSVSHPEAGDAEHSEILVFSASVDSTVRVWSVVGQDAKEVQTLSYGDGFALTVASFAIPTINTPMLACGCDDHKIHLYARDDSKKFVKLISLHGHEDWIRGLHFTTDVNGDILLASCAQDHFIRVWRFEQKAESDPSLNTTKAIAEMALEEDIVVKETLFTFTSKGAKRWFAVRLESVLSGHENWVYSVRWRPTEKGKMQLLSASMDKTMILWSPDADSGLWMEQVRVGDVGGNTLGFYGGLFSPCGHSILGHGYQGAFNQWTYDMQSNSWLPEVTGGGHFDSVVDLAWARSGDFLLTASADQTTRLHAPWVHADKLTWCEVARPQVHGYNLSCLAAIGKFSFASGADEKLVRVFAAPRNFVSNFCQICGHDLNKEMEDKEIQSLPEGANVPALGLSNKAVFTADVSRQKDVEGDGRPGQYPENYFTPTSLTEPPTEDQLLQNTLWPEEGKLYGHGYEIFSLAAHPSGKLLASACKAARADVANILLWDLTTKKSVASLSGCSLTVTQMAFSHHGNRLLAVSRDRTWVLYKQNESGEFMIEASVNKKTSSHSRIIWSCAWSHDDLFFLTASRDKTVCVWSVTSLTQQCTEQPKPTASLTLPDSVTAISTAPTALSQGRYLLAAGLDSGQVLLYVWSPDGGSHGWTNLATLSQIEAHHLTVNRLAFRPSQGKLSQPENKGDLQLASCGSDHTVRVFDISLDASLL